MQQFYFEKINQSFLSLENLLGLKCNNYQLVCFNGVNNEGEKVIELRWFFFDAAVSCQWGRHGELFLYDIITIFIHMIILRDSWMLTRKTTYAAIFW